MTAFMLGLQLQCKNLKEQVKCILQLRKQEPSLHSQNVAGIHISLIKSIYPKWGIWFAIEYYCHRSLLADRKVIINMLLENDYQ
jgi:hypothetical protein